MSVTFIMLHAGTECVEHIQILITSMQEADNAIPAQEKSCGLLLSTIRVGVVKIFWNKRI